VVAIPDASPSIDLLLDHEKVSGWTEWLKRYYPKGNTVQNKCQHAASFLTHLTTVKGYGDSAPVLCKITHCQTIINAAAQDGKIKGIQQKADKVNEEELMSQGQPSISHTTFFQLLKYYLFIFYFTHFLPFSAGKVLTEEEGKTAYQWFCQKWRNKLPYFTSTRLPAPAEAAGTTWLVAAAFLLQNHSFQQLILIITIIIR
jgi:hypothetical protein